MFLDEKLRWYGYWTLDALQGSPVRKYYNEIENGWINGTSVDRTKGKIDKLISHAINTTSFYKKYSKGADLKDLPVVNKNIYRENYADFLSSKYANAKDNRVMITSGSTGTPFQMIQNKNKIQHNTGGSIWLGVAAGYYIGMKEAFIRFWSENKKKSRFRLFQENLIMVDSTKLDEKSLGELCLIIKNKKVKCLVGYSSALEELSKYIDKKGLSNGDFSVKVIIPISEAMPDGARKRLSEQFHCPVRSWYSNEENGIMGLQNEEDDGYRIDTESYFYEILKMDSDEPVEPGELGRIVITDLYNYAFPILRYDCGDTAIASKIEKDGRFKLYLNDLYGRQRDLIYDVDGYALHPVFISNIIYKFKGIKQYRFIQEDIDQYTLVLNGELNIMDQKELLYQICQYIGERAKVAIEFVDEMPVLASGKRRSFENKCEVYLNNK